MKTYIYVPFKPWYSKKAAGNTASNHTQDVYKAKKDTNPNVMIYPAKLSPTKTATIYQKYEHGVFENTGNKLYSKGNGEPAKVTKKDFVDNQWINVRTENVESKSYLATKQRYIKALDKESGDILTTEDVKNLSILQSNDTLAIEGHGLRAPMGAAIQENVIGTFNHNKTKWVFLNHIDLAQMLKDDGLKIDHILIQLETCYGGGAFPGEQLGFDSSFAKLLAVALGNMGYKKIIVSGCQGKLIELSYTTAEAGGGELKTKNKNRRFFDAEGDELEWESALLQQAQAH